MTTYSEEIARMISLGQLTNSYKLYLLKVIFQNCTNSKQRFSFYELSCLMCAYSFSEVCRLKKRIRPLDKLYDNAVLLISSENVLTTSDTNKVFESLYYTNNKKLRNSVSSLCNYAPYRLLSYKWQSSLSGKTDSEKNEFIERESNYDNSCIYRIETVENEAKYIVINNDWVRYIVNNRESLCKWIDEQICCFIKGN